MSTPLFSAANLAERYGVGRRTVDKVARKLGLGTKVTGLVGGGKAVVVFTMADAVKLDAWYAARSRSGQSSVIAAQFGDWVASKRRDHEESAAGMARRASMDPAQWRRVERGGSMPSEATVRRVLETIATLEPAGALAAMQKAWYPKLGIPLDS